MSLKKVAIKNFDSGYILGTTVIQHHEARISPQNQIWSALQRRHRKQAKPT